MGDIVRYNLRMAAVEFTIEHDDGQSLRALEKADVILLATSRCGKTPDVLGTFDRLVAVEAPRSGCCPSTPPRESTSRRCGPVWRDPASVALVTVLWANR